MNIEEAQSSLHRGYTVLQNLPVEKAQLGNLVLEGLRHLIEAGMPACLSEPSGCPEFPFPNHFFEELASLPRDDDSHWFTLFEDMSVLFRARALSEPGVETPEIERRILDAFEALDMWGKEDLVWQWYWKILPERHAVLA